MRTKPDHADAPDKAGTFEKINKIAFVGAGKMASAIIRGLLQSGLQREHVHASTASQSSCKNVSQTLGVFATTDNAEICRHADIVVLAVKPQIMQSVCEHISSHIDKHTLIISVAAGIQVHALERWLGSHAIVRCMPNTPSSINMGASALFSNKRVTGDQKMIAEAMFASVGLVIHVEKESLINSVTAVSGSGPAYFFLFMESMLDAGKELGLTHQQAHQLAVQTALGASALAKQSDIALPQLRENVTSVKGTTEQAIFSFEKSALRKTVRDAMQACFLRAEELERELSSK